MNIEDGKYYRTRDGRKVGPMVAWSDYFCADLGTVKERLWWPDGRRGSRAVPNDPNLDLIAEWSDPEPAKGGLPWVCVGLSFIDELGTDDIATIEGTKDGVSIDLGQRIATFTPANARALAIALTAYADQAEAAK